MRGRVKNKINNNKKIRKKNRIPHYINLILSIEIVFILSLFVVHISRIFIPKGVLAYKSSLVLAKEQINLYPSITPTKSEKRQIPVAMAEVNHGNNNDYCLDVPVVMYHHVEPLNLAQNAGHAQLTVDSQVFESQMAYLSASGYHGISSNQLVEALINHTGLPNKSVLLTFDDGYEDNFVYAYNTMKKYGIVGNFAIPTGLINNNGYMSWDQIRELVNDPQMHIYNHTWSHASLGGANLDKIQYEISTANEQIRNETGQGVNIFYYPYGSSGPEVVDALKKFSFIGAFSTIEGRLQCQSYIFALRRIRVGNAPLASYGF